MRKKKVTTRSTGRLHTKEQDRVLGNRHVGNAWCQSAWQKPRPPGSRSPPRRLTKRARNIPVVISPQRKFEQFKLEREEEFANYRSLVEQRFTQMLEEERTKLRR